MGLTWKWGFFSSIKLFSPKMAGEEGEASYSNSHLKFHGASGNSKSAHELEVLLLFMWLSRTRGREGEGRRRSVAVIQRERSSDRRTVWNLLPRRCSSSTFFLFLSSHNYFFATFSYSRARHHESEHPVPVPMIISPTLCDSQLLTFPAWPFGRAIL